MDALRVPFGQPDQTGATEGTEAGSNANVTGFNGPLAMAGINALGAVPGMNPLAALGPLLGALAGPAAKIGMNMGANSIPSSLTDSFGNPVSYTGNFMGLPTGSLHGLNMGQVDTAPADPNQPSLSQSYDIPSVAPNVGPYRGPSGNGINIPSTFAGSQTPGIFTAHPTDPTTPDPGTPTGATGPTAPAAPTEGNEGVGIAGVASAPAGGGESAPGDAGGAGGAYKKGGRVRGQRPDPRMLAAKLRQGAKVDVGDPRATTDNVKRVDLQTGEEVMNRPAARAHAAQLEAWNRTGRRAMGQGGMAVGAPRDQRR